MAKKIHSFIIVAIAFVYNIAMAQPLTNQQKQQLQAAELSIKEYGKQMINEEEWINRFIADSAFTKGFVQALKIHNSFYYSFDSLITVSKLYAPDSSFKIFTWQIMKDFSYYRQRGAIQMKTADGSLQLFPLFDASHFIKNPNDSLRDNKQWIGAIYYKILLNYAGSKKVYTLLGFDENDARSNKKWIDILTFTEDNKPLFGGRYFQYATDDTKPKQPCFRFNVEYKKDARLRMLYDEEDETIVFDHVISESNEPANKYTLIPDGTYEGFKWIQNKWVHIPKISQLNLGNGNAPQENLLLDENGNINQKKLNEQNKKNMKNVTASPNNTPLKAGGTKTKRETSKEKVDY
jgi:hypothetical protein